MAIALDWPSALHGDMLEASPCWLAFTGPKYIAQAAVGVKPSLSQL